MIAPAQKAENEQRKAHRDAWVAEQERLRATERAHGCLACYGHGFLVEESSNGARLVYKAIPGYAPKPSSWTTRHVRCQDCSGTGMVGL